MTDFKIRQGKSYELFDNVEQRIINPKLKIEVGCWYLCNDTADLFVGTQEADNSVILKQINAESFLLGLDIDRIKQDIVEVKTTQLYVKINSSSELPTDFSASEFNPNITYYTTVEDETGGTVSIDEAFIFDSASNCYLNANSADLDIIQDFIQATVDNVVEESISQNMSEALQDTLSTSIIFGGSASDSN